MCLNMCNFTFYFFLQKGNMTPSNTSENESTMGITFISHGTLNSLVIMIMNSKLNNCIVFFGLDNVFFGQEVWKHTHINRFTICIMF